MDHTENVLEEPLEDELDEYLSDCSDTTFFDDEKLTTSSHADKTTVEVWNYTIYRMDGKVHIFGEWTARTISVRHAVIGPDW